VKILIDTHIFLWSLGDTKKLSEKRLLELRSQANIVYLSSISIAELMIKSSIGKLKIDYDVIEMVKESGIELLDFTAEDAVLLKELPLHHKDPFDRMLVCQSKTNKMKLMTDDKKIQLYDCKVI
jgi:PIN domain nuclease of toxin-antitoxin system